MAFFLCIGCGGFLSATTTPTDVSLSADYAADGRLAPAVYRTFISFATPRFQS